MSDLVDKNFPTYSSIISFVLEKLLMFFHGQNINIDAIRDSFDRSIIEFVDRGKMSKKHGETIMRHTVMRYDEDGKIFVDIPEEIGAIILNEEKAFQNELKNWKDVLYEDW